MARIRIVDSWLRSPASPPAHQRAVMIVADAWAEQRVLMRAYANCPDQTRPTIVLHGVHLAIGPAGLDPHGPWGIHVEPPADGRAQELRAQLELAARRLAGSKGNPPRLMDEVPSFDRKHTNTWAPGTPPDLPPPSGQPHPGPHYYEPSASWQAAHGPPPAAPDMSGAFAGGPPPPAPPPGASHPPPAQPGPAYPAQSWQHAPLAAPYPAPGPAGSYPPPAQHAGSYRAPPGHANQGWPGNQSEPRGWTSPVPSTPPLRDMPPVRPSGYPAASASEHRGAAHGGRAGSSTAFGFAGGEGARAASRPASGPRSDASARMASIVGRTMPVGFQLSPAERNVLDALGEAMQLSASQVARIAGVHDGTVWMATFMAKLAGFGLDVIALGPYTGTEPTYTLRR